MLIYVRLLFYILKPNKMSDYTQKEIEEMRKRLPFKAVVWDNEENTYSKIVVHIFNDGCCADHETVHAYFKEVKEPQYVPFDKESVKPFRDEWVIISSTGVTSKVIAYNDKRIDTVYENKNYEEALDEWKFADSGKPFGKEMKQ